MYHPEIFARILPQMEPVSPTPLVNVREMTANSHIRVIGAGFLPVALGLPAAVAVDQLCQVGRLLGVSGDELVLQKFFGRWPLWTRSTFQTDKQSRWPIIHP